MYLHRSFITTFVRPGGRGWRCGLALKNTALGVVVGLALVAAAPAQAMTFQCSSGDVPCLIAAINMANANGESNTILLDTGTYTLTAVDNNTNGPNGLPSITSSLRLVGTGAGATIIERQASAPTFRLMHVAGTGDLTLRQLTLRGGAQGLPATLQGGGLFNSGNVKITHSEITGNGAHFGGGLYNANGTVILIRSVISENRTSGPSGGAGGGIYNAPGGSVTIRRSTLASNVGSAVGGGIFNDTGGAVNITNSSLTSNMSFDPGTGGGIDNFGDLTLTNSTLSGNSARRIGAINSVGTTTVTNSTISGNSGQTTGGVSGTFTLQNTILALNTSLFAPDCIGGTSLGNNVIGDTTRCGIVLQPTDLTGDAGLDAFSDDGTPGNGHYPLLSTSQAIGAANDDVCPTRDQIGQPRHHPCDIGSIEFPDRH